MTATRPARALKSVEGGYRFPRKASGRLVSMLTALKYAGALCGQLVPRLDAEALFRTYHATPHDRAQQPFQARVKCNGFES